MLARSYPDVAPTLLGWPYMSLQIRRPSVGVFRTRQRGRFTSPLPPSAGPLRRPFGPKPRGAALKVRTPTTWPAKACRNHAPQGGVLPEGHFGTPPKSLVLGFEVLELLSALAKLGSTLLGLGSALVGLPPKGAEGAPWQREALPPPKAARSAAPPDRPKIGAFTARTKARVSGNTDAPGTEWMN